MVNDARGRTLMLKGQAKKDYQREYMRGYMRDRRRKKQGVKTQELDPIVTYPTGSEYAEGLPIFEIPNVTYTVRPEHNEYSAMARYCERVVPRYLDADGNPVYEEG